MQYNQPYGMPPEVTLYDTPYINGDPSIGRAGSIPPAFSIEHDQREIVEVIQYAYDHGYRDHDNNICNAPSSSDLTQLMKAIWGFINSNRLAVNLTYYVSNFGDDTNDGLTSGTAFKTIQHAVNMTQMFDPNGFTMTIYVADGTYAAFMCGAGGNLKGFGVLTIIGNFTHPENVVITTSTAQAAASFNGSTRLYYFGGFKLVNTGVYPNALAGIVASFAQNVVIYNIEFGATSTYHIWASVSYITLAGRLDQIPGVANPFIRVTGNTQLHMRASEGGAIGSHVPDLNIPNAVHVNVWCDADNLSHILCVGAPDGSQPNFYNSITGKANVTGQTYSASQNSIINENGGGVSYFPGTIAGVVNTGGQYI